MTVLEELDAIKNRRDKDVSREARIAINTIDGILKNATPKDIQSGVDAPSTLKAKGSGLEHVEDYRKDQVVDDIQLMAKGYQQYEGQFWSQIEGLETIHGDDGSVTYRLN